MTCLHSSSEVWHISEVDSLCPVSESWLECINTGRTEVEDIKDGLRWLTHSPSAFDRYQWMTSQRGAWLFEVYHWMTSFTIIILQVTAGGRAGAWGESWCVRVSFTDSLDCSVSDVTRSRDYCVVTYIYHVPLPTVCMHCTRCLPFAFVPIYPISRHLLAAERNNMVRVRWLTRYGCGVGTT